MHLLYDRKGKSLEWTNPIHSNTTMTFFFIFFSLKYYFHRLSALNHFFSFNFFFSLYIPLPVRNVVRWKWPNEIKSNRIYSRWFQSNAFSMEDLLFILAVKMTNPSSLETENHLHLKTKVVTYISTVYWVQVA